jgi:hypothetical protein
MIVGTANGRRNPQGLGVHACLLSIGRAAISEDTTEAAVFSTFDFPPYTSLCDLVICAPALMPATLAALPPIRRIPNPAYSDL